MVWSLALCPDDTKQDSVVYGMDQPGNVVNPPRGRLNTNNKNISLSALLSETLVSRDGFGSPLPRQPAHLQNQAESGAMKESERDTDYT